MVSFLSSLLLALIVLIIVLIATFIVTLGFLFVGGVLADWFSLTRLEATATTIVVGFMLIYLVLRILEIPGPFAHFTDDEEDEEEPPRRPQPKRSRRKR